MGDEEKEPCQRVSLTPRAKGRLENGIVFSVGGSGRSINCVLSLYVSYAKRRAK